MDDVMRLMLERSARGFTGADIERAVEDVCACDVTQFFDAHVRGGTPIDFDRCLRPLGFRAIVSEVAASDRNGAPSVDTGVWAWVSASDHKLRVRISNPENAWGRAGLHTGDELISVNGKRVESWPEFRTLLAGLKIGDTLRFQVARPTGTTEITVIAARLIQKSARIEPLGASTPRAQRLAESWSAGR
jgi:predicted metalloprotease with PDZ domain